MITIFEQEIADGLSDAISKNLSVAFQCLVKKEEAVDPNNEAIKKSIAGFIEGGRNFDLYHISSILASVGDNKNDDWFLPEEIWAARETPVFKQVNYGHNEKDIIGVITDTNVLDIDGNSFSDEENVSNLKDIVSHSVIWSYWEDIKLKDRFENIVSRIEDGTLFVSMETLFKNFDYMLVDKITGVQSIIKRTKETSFLTKYLRIYNKEASGEYNGARIYRLLRNFTFSGQAIVENPANIRSIISDSLQKPEDCCCGDCDVCNSRSSYEFKSLAEDVSDNFIVKTLAENIMDPNEVMISTLKAELASAKAELESFKQAEAEKTSAEINDLKTSNENLQKQVAELTQLAQAAKEDMEKAECKAEEDKKFMKEECEVKVAEANAKIQTLESEKATAARMFKLTSMNVESAKAEEILKTWASVSDEHFNKVVELYAVKAPEAGNTGFDLDTTKSTASVVNPNGDSDSDKAVAIEKALASKIAAQFNFTKNKKGSK